MAETTISPEDTAALQAAAREFDRARLQQVAGFHFALVLAALTLYGAAETWAQVTGWGIAGLVAVGNAVVAAFVLHSTIHEWGHFAGARLSGSVSPVLDAPRRHFFMFDFPIDRNDLSQFTWMSWGGILAPWLVVLLVASFVPLGTLAAKVLLATLIMKAVSTAAFEVPIVLRAQHSGKPGVELGRQAQSGGLPRSRRVGAVVGAACFALMWLGG